MTGSTESTGHARVRRRAPFAITIGVALGAAAVATFTPIGLGRASADNGCGRTSVSQNVFTGAIAGGDWNNPLNWTGGVPHSGEICVPSGKTANIGNGTYLTSLTGASLINDGTIRAGDLGTHAYTNDNNGQTDIYNRGRFEVANGAIFEIPAGIGQHTFHNEPTGVVSVGQGGVINLSQTLINNGTIDATGGTFNVVGPYADLQTGTGTVAGGEITGIVGAVTFGGVGGGTFVLRNIAIKGTIGPNMSVSLACKTFSGGVTVTDNLVNNGVLKFIPPLDGAGCTEEIRFDQTGKTITNNAMFIVGDPGNVKGPGFYGTSHDASHGTLVNSATGTITLNDRFQSELAVGGLVNNGTMTIAPTGSYSSTDTVTNNGTLVNGNGCNIYVLNNNGLFDLQKSCTVRRGATLEASSTLRVHSSAAALTGLSGMAIASPINGVVDVVTDPNSPPALGTTRDVFAATGGGSSTGHFTAVTGSISATLGYKDIYPASNAPGAQLQVVSGNFGGGGGGGGASAITALVPARVLDTRADGSTIDGAGQGAGVQGTGSTIEVQVTGRAGVPADASAAVLNVTVTEAQAPGYVTVFPCGSTRPNASSVNFVAGSTVPNGVIAKIGTDGKICLYVSNPTQLLVDVAGYFGAGSPYSPLVPARVLDTRTTGETTDGQGRGAGLAALGSVTEVQITGRGGVPTTGAGAAVLNVTVTEAQAAGFVTVFPCGSDRPNASSLNFVTGSTVANNVVAKIGDGGKVCLYVSNATHLIADVAGYFAPGAGFNALLPARLLDTRGDGRTVDGAAQAAGLQPLGAVIEVQVTGRAGVPVGAPAATLNVTVTEAQAPGFVTVFPCGSTRPNASSLNFVAGSTVPNGVIAKIGDGGKVCLFVSNATHLIADVSGYFSG